MPHQFGLPGFAPSPSPPHHARIGGAVVPQSASAAVFRPQIEDKRLTRDAMERYMRERNDMVIVILHAKVKFEKGKVVSRGGRWCKPCWFSGRAKILRQRETFLLSAAVYISVRQWVATSSGGNAAERWIGTGRPAVCVHWDREFGSGHATVRLKQWETVLCRQNVIHFRFG